MARKTKEAADLTRQKILEAARQVFDERGVTRTTLEQIAQAAGVTRGAVYWHFANKTELFFAMRDQVTLPMIDRSDTLLFVPGSDDPLGDIEASLIDFFQIMQACPDVRRTFDIMMLRCEYVGEFAPVLHQILESAQAFRSKLEQAYGQAAGKNQLVPGQTPQALAFDTWLFISGLIRYWLSVYPAPAFIAQVPALIRQHMGMRRMKNPTPPVPR